MSNTRWTDAHGHAGAGPGEEIGLAVVNGTEARDWPAAAELSRKFPGRVVAALGWHPWKLGGREPGWRENLRGALRALVVETGTAAVGEIGLEFGRRRETERAEQEAAFLEQWGVAAELGLAACLHGGGAYGRLLELTRGAVRLPRGFLLHGYGGSAEMVADFAAAGASFSFGAAILDERREKARRALRMVPGERLMLETDGPLNEATAGRLEEIYRAAAELRGESVGKLAERTEANARRMFGLSEVFHCHPA